MDKYKEKIDTLMANRALFDQFVYTSQDEAVLELKRRVSDETIPDPKNLPNVCKDGMKAILYVSVITPNQQIIKYIDMAREMNIEPLIFEQVGDKFTSNNEWKYFLGKLSLFVRRSRDGAPQFEHLNIIDFNTSNGKKISEVKTFWNESLVDFHHRIFFEKFPNLTAQNIFEASDWFHQCGTTPREYYVAFMSLLIKHGIQFENFYLNEKENFFTREIFLPAFMTVYEQTGLKPLIVALEPEDSEGDEFWYSHDMIVKDIVVKSNQ
jgi:hypothetical protein